MKKQRIKGLTNAFTYAKIHWLKCMILIFYNDKSIKIIVNKEMHELQKAKKSRTIKKIIKKKITPHIK